jgi:hypothetical protein
MVQSNVAQITDHPDNFGGRWPALTSLTGTHYEFLPDRVMIREVSLRKGFVYDNDQRGSGSVKLGKR